ncbi:glycogen phosphorylase, partial [Pseudomonas sp. AH2 (2023)]|nr:glycogen phosphorylase [Pseudomonas sp. AH2 (2023)]
LGRDAHSVSNRYRYMATVLAVRDRLVERWKATHAAYYDADCKRGYYLSMEFLMGRALGSAALNLDIDNQLKRSLTGLGLRLEDLE